MDDPSAAEHWDAHWRRASARPAPPAHPYLARELGGLAPGTALDAGCGEGTEAIWLAHHGWRVTAVDVSATALARAAEHAEAAGVADRVAWVHGDLTTWQPAAPFDLVTTHYAHPDMPPTAFWARLSGWVAPGGTLLVVAHREDAHAGTAEHAHVHPADDDHRPPGAAGTTVEDVVGALDPTRWRVVTATAEDRRREPAGTAPHHAPEHDHPHADGVLRDVVVRAVRAPALTDRPAARERTQP